MAQPKPNNQQQQQQQQHQQQQQSSNMRRMPESALLKNPVEKFIDRKDDYYMRCYLQILSNYGLDTDTLPQLLYNAKPSRWSNYQLIRLKEILNPIQSIKNIKSPQRKQYMEQSPEFRDLQRRSPDLFRWMHGTANCYEFNDFMESLNEFAANRSVYNNDYEMLRSRMLHEIHLSNNNNNNNNNNIINLSPQNRRECTTATNTSTPSQTFLHLSPPNTSSSSTPSKLIDPHHQQSPSSSSSSSSQSPATRKRPKSPATRKELLKQQKSKAVIRNWMTSLFVDHLFPEYWPDPIICIFIHQYAWLYHKLAILDACCKAGTKKRVENLDIKKLIQFAYVCKIIFILHLYTHLYSIYIHIIYNI